ncbi:MAG: hypothetical protein GWN16_06140, partial [Calditrichae bacterium]|nr:hypothetical protein [Calditrichia bacterium]
HRTDNTGFQAYLEGIYEQFPGIEDRQIVHRQTRLTDDPVLAKKIQDYAIYQQGMLELFSEKQKQFDSLSNF